MKKIFLSAGHSNKVGEDRGASSKDGKLVEGVLAAEFRHLLNERLMSLGVSTISDPDDTILLKSINFIKGKLGINDIAMEFHFNAAGSEQATGVEVLVPDNPSKNEMIYANNICKIFADTLHIRNRGVKTEIDSARGKLGFMRINGENILIEICFITNKTDMFNFISYQQVLVNALADYIIQILK